MEIEYFFYKIFDAIDKNFFKKAHASGAKAVNSQPAYFCMLFQMSK